MPNDLEGWASWEWMRFLDKLGMTKEKNMIAILHNIRSLHNVGSIFRTADGAGVEKLYLCGITPAPVDRFGKKRPQLAKVSLGAEDFVRWEKRGSAARLIERLKSEGYLVVAIEQNKKARSIDDLDEILLLRGNDNLALVFGSEVKGLPKSILDKCDAIVEIPMYGKKESLNVAVAFGIIAYAIIPKIKI